MFQPCRAAQHDYESCPILSDIPLLSAHCTTVLLCKNAVQRRIWCALSLYEFAPVVSADAPVVMKYGFMYFSLTYRAKCPDDSETAHCVCVCARRVCMSVLQR